MTLYSEHVVRSAVARHVGEDVAARVLRELRAYRPRRPSTRRVSDRALRITARGRTRTIREWARATGISEWTIRDRIRRGWPLDKAVTVKPQRGPITGRNAA